MMVVLRADQLNAPVLPDEVSAVAEQVLLGRPTQSERPEVIQTHLGRARFPRIPAKQIMDLETLPTFIYTHSTQTALTHADKVQN